MEIYRIFPLKLQKFEERFIDERGYVPSLLRFRSDLCIGIYIDDSLVGTFILLPYKEGGSRILRIERPLVDEEIIGKKRSEIFNTMKEYTMKFAESLLFDFIEMELYSEIDDDVYFPSSLSTIGTFNLPSDYNYLVDETLTEVKTTICFNIMKSTEAYHIEKKKGTPSLKENRESTHWYISNPNSLMIRGLYSTLMAESGETAHPSPTLPPFIKDKLYHSFLPVAFNLPEYLLIRREPKPALIQWFPDLYLLSNKNWRPIIGNKQKIYKRLKSVNRGKVYRILGLNTIEFIREIDKIWKVKPLSNISILQIFSDVCYQDAISDAGYRIVHTLRRFRKNVRS